MTKRELMRLFPEFSPRRAFRRFDEGEEVPWEVTGKWVRAVLMEDGAWDLFLCNTRDMAKGMGTKRLNLLVATLPEGSRHVVLDGEAWWRCRDLAVVRAWLETHRVSLGIHKRVEVSEAVREARFLAGKLMHKRRTEALPPSPTQG